MKRLLDLFRRMMGPRFCIDCKWYVYDAEGPFCVQRRFQSNVTGEIRIARTRCEANRESDHGMACGKSARFFKPKE